MSGCELYTNFTCQEFVNQKLEKIFFYLFSYNLIELTQNKWIKKNK